MKPEHIVTDSALARIRLALAVFALVLAAGCANLNLPDGPDIPPTVEAPARPPIYSSSRVVHTTRTSRGQACGALFDFVLDIHRLERIQQAELLEEMSDESSKRFFCDQLKAGILLSQIGRTIEEDDRAIALIDQYVTSDQLNNGERWLLRLLQLQSRERRRLHVLLNEFGNKLVTQESLSRNLSSDLVTLRKQLDQLQKIEADINETQQSISAPAAALDQQATPNPDS